MPKKNAFRLAVSLMISLAAFPSALRAEAGPPDELALPACEGILQTCLKYRKDSDAEILRLRALVQGQKEHEKLIGTQRDEAFDLAEKPGAPLIPTELAIGGGAVLGFLIMIAVVAFAGGKK